MIKCLRIRKKLLPYLDNVLSDRDRVRVQEHLKTCVNCREKLKSLKEVEELLAKNPEVKRSENYWQEFQSKLKHRLTPHYRLAPPVRLFRMDLVFVACSIIFVFLTSVVLMREHRLMFSYRDQLLRFQTKLAQFEKEKQAHKRQLAILEKIAQAPRYQVVVLQKQTPVTGKGEPCIFYRETIPINNLKEL